MPRSAVPLREALLCPLLDEARRLHLALLVLREGRRCSLLRTLRGYAASISTSELGLETLRGALDLPVRVLSGPGGHLLGAQVLLANRHGPGFYVLGEPLSPLEK